MKLPSYRRIFDTDFEPQFKDFIRTLSVSVNNGFEVLFEALNKKLSLKDNMLCTLKDIDVEVDATGKPKTTTSFILDIDSKVEGLVVLNALNLKNSTVYPQSGIFCSFVQSNKSIIINNVTGLQANTLYKLRIVAFG